MTGVHHTPRPNPESGQQYPAGGRPVSAQYAASMQPQQPLGVGGQQAPRGASHGVDKHALAALVLAVVGLVFAIPLSTGVVALVLGVLALVFGIMALLRSRRGPSKSVWMVVTALVLGSLVTFGGTFNSVVLTQTAMATFDAPSYSPSPSYIGSSAPTYAAPPPYAGPTAAAPTSYTYEVIGNYSAGSLSYTQSNGDSKIDVQGTKLPWKATVDPEPNGNGQYLSATTNSTKGDSSITCTLKDDKGNVVDTDTKKGAYASCMVRT